MPAISPIAPPSPRLLLGVAAVLILLIPILNQIPSAQLDVCYIRRERQLPPRPLIPLGDSALHNYSVYVMWIAMLILSLLPRRRTHALFSLTLCSLWFHQTYILLAALKAPLADVACAGRDRFFPNGISGHYCYFIFVALTAPRFASRRRRDNPSASPILLATVAILLLLFGIGGFATLYRTFFHGYHSIRHILLGAALGIVSYIGLYYFHLAEDSRTIDNVLGVLYANSAIVIALYAYLWPHLKTTHALGWGQAKFHFVLWLLLIFFSRRLTNQPAKQAND